MTVSGKLAREGREKVLHDALVSGDFPRLGSWIREARENIENGHEYPVPFIDALGQYWRQSRTGWDDCETFAAMQVMSLIRAGTIGVFQIDVGDEPLADKLKDANNDMLKNMPHPFSARFWGGTQDEDGIVSVATPHHCMVNVNNELFQALCESDDYPLEVGYNSASKLLVNIMVSYSGLARWPYGQKRVTVFVKRFYGKGHKKFRGLVNDSWDTRGEFVERYHDFWQTWQTVEPA